MRRAASSLFLAAALLLLALPGLPTLLQPARDISELEARRLAPPPGRPDGIAGLRSWPAAAEAWLQDHLAGRDWLLGRFAQLRYLLQEPAGSEVVFGQGRVLFLRSSHRLATAAGWSLDAAAREMMAALFAGWTRAAAAAGVPLLVVLVPDKETIMAEALPWWARGFESEAVLERLLGRVAAWGGVDLLDLRPVLRADPGRAVYYDEDTHWNGYGAYLGYRALVDRLRGAFPDLQPLTGDAVAWVRQTSAQELRRMLGLPPSADATVEDQPRPAAPRGVPQPPEAGLSYLALRPETPGPRLLVMNDSYGVALRPWLQESTPAFAVSPLRGPRQLAALLRRYPSDLAVVVLVERNLVNPHVWALLTD